MSDPRPIKGLHASIWDNNVKSILLLCVYPFILSAVIFAVLFALSFFSGNQLPVEIHTQHAMGLLYQWWPIILGVVGIWFVIAYFFQGIMIRAMSHSHPVARKDEPELYNLVENMCIATGTPMPRLEIIESHARNAFASGINQQTYCITVTRGLMQSLSKDELEGVLAHELTHILNRDVRLMMVCVVFTGMLGIACQLLWSNFRYGLYLPRRSSGNGKGGGIWVILIAVMVILWVGYMATLLARFAISRTREYMADAGAVSITKNPDAMMRALIRISGAADIPKAPADIKAMCFENARPFLGFFATHPPIQARIQAIADYSALPVPDLKPKISASDEEAFGRPAPPRENWTTRQRFKERRPANPWQ